MSYRVNIVVIDGVIGIEETGGELPEGSWQIGGYEDEHSTSIHVVRRLPNGRHVAEAQHHFAHKNYDDSKFEAPEPDPARPERNLVPVHKYPIGPPTPSDGTTKQGMTVGLAMESEEQRIAHQPPDDIGQWHTGMIRTDSSHSTTAGVTIPKGKHAMSKTPAASSVSFQVGSPYFDDINLPGEDLTKQDIPLPEGERYPEGECGYCGRMPGARSMPCRYCTDVSSVSAIDTFAEPGQITLCSQCGRTAGSPNIPCKYCPDLETAAECGDVPGQNY